MGLLDDILGQLAGDEARGQRAEAPASRPQASAGGGLDMTKVIAALLPVIIGMLANRQAGRPEPIRRARAAGSVTSWARCSAAGRVARAVSATSSSSSSVPGSVTRFARG